MTDMKENKQYRLKRWCPSLPISWRTDDGYEYDVDRQVMINISNIKNGIAMPKEMAIKEQEIHPDLWELIEEGKLNPLFITEDGVEILSDIDDLYAVNLTYFNKTKHMLRYSGWLIENSAYKVFYLEYNADAYIKANKPKPLFVTEDGVEVFDGDVDVFTTNSSFNKYRFKAKRIKDSGLNHKIFYHESNLYNYIWRNKRVFSYEDIKEYFECEGKFYDVKSIAKERAK